MEGEQKRHRGKGCLSKAANELGIVLYVDIEIYLSSIQSKLCIYHKRNVCILKWMFKSEGVGGGLSKGFLFAYHAKLGASDYFLDFTYKKVPCNWHINLLKC